MGVQLRGKNVRVAWNNLTAVPYNTSGGEFITIAPPPARRTRLWVTDGVMRLTALAPIVAVDHAPRADIQLTGIIVEIAYGLGFASQPSPGDSEQIVLITAKSPQPIRLKRLVLTADRSVAYTNAKGFIIDPTRVLDLSIACIGPATVMYSWLAAAMNILPAESLLAPYVAASCARPVSKAYWLAPSRPMTPRTTAVRMQVLAEFG